MTRRARFAVLFMLSSAALLAGYVSQNLVKINWSTEKLVAIWNSPPATRLQIELLHETLAFDLPTSDLIDRSGQRQINFKYITRKQLDSILTEAGKSRISLNGQPIKKVMLIRHRHAFSLILPGHHVFLIAPPHMKTAVQRLKAEYLNRQDIFFCNGSERFCNETAITNFGGLSELNDASLKEDSFFDHWTAPRGRYMGKITRIEITTANPQPIIMTFDLALPFNTIKDVRVMVDGSQTKYHFEPGDADNIFKPAKLRILFPLQNGKNTLKFALSKLLNANDEIPFDTTGMITRMVYRPMNK